MKIGNVSFGDRPIVLAPMEDVTNPPFRACCKSYGADWMYTEFVSSDALVRNVEKTLKKLSIDEGERPVTIQIYGKDPEALAGDMSTAISTTAIGIAVAPVGLICGLIFLGLFLNQKKREKIAGA